MSQDSENIKSIRKFHEIVDDVNEIMEGEYSDEDELSNNESRSDDNPSGDIDNNNDITPEMINSNVEVEQVTNANDTNDYEGEVDDETMNNQGDEEVNGRWMTIGRIWMA